MTQFNVYRYWDENSCHWNCACGQILFSWKRDANEAKETIQGRIVNLSEPLVSFVCQTADNCAKAILQRQGRNLIPVFFVHVSREGGWRYWNSKLEILAAPLASSSIFYAPPPGTPPVGYEIYRFSEPPPGPTNFSEPRLRVSKIFGAPPQYLYPSRSPLVILNELSLIASAKTSITR